MSNGKYLKETWQSVCFNIYVGNSSVHNIKIITKIMTYSKGIKKANH